MKHGITAQAEVEDRVKKEKASWVGAPISVSDWGCSVLSCLPGVLPWLPCYGGLYLRPYAKMNPAFLRLLVLGICHSIKEAIHCCKANKALLLSSLCKVSIAYVSTVSTPCGEAAQRWGPAFWAHMLVDCCLQFNAESLDSSFVFSFDAKCVVFILLFFILVFKNSFFENFIIYILYIIIYVMECDHRRNSNLYLTLRMLGRKRDIYFWYYRHKVLGSTKGHRTASI